MEAIQLKLSNALILIIQLIVICQWNEYKCNKVHKLISYHLSTKLEGIDPRGYSPQDLVLKSIGLKTNQLSIHLNICTFKNYLAK